MNDYISREYLLDVLLPHSWHGTNKNIVPYNDRRGYRQRDREVREVIINAPSADVRENVHGKWISELELYGEGKWNYQCSVCGRSIRLEQNETLDDYQFCHCGADMRGNT